MKQANHNQASATLRPLCALLPAQCSSMVCVQSGALLLVVCHDSVESSACVNANRTALASVGSLRATPTAVKIAPCE